jgi:hypothetical protein
MNLLNIPMPRVSCPNAENPENHFIQKFPKLISLILCYNSSLTRPLTQTLPFTNVSCGNRVRGKSNIGRSLASDMY